MGRARRPAATGPVDRPAASEVTSALTAAGRREAFLAAVEDLMSEGRSDFTVQEVTEAAGESLRTFYQHFVGKRELIVALLERHFEQLAASVRREASTQDDPVGALQAALLGLYRLSSPRAFRKALPVAQFGATLVHSDPALYARVQAPLVAAVERLVRAALPEHPSPLRTAASAINVVLAAARRNAVLVAHGTRPVTTDEVWRALDRVLLQPAGQ